MKLVINKLLFLTCVLLQCLSPQYAFYFLKRWLIMYWMVCSKNPLLEYYTFKAITRWTEACYWKLYTRANQKYLNIYEKPYIILFIPHNGTRKGVDGMPLFFLVLLRQSEINENLLNSLEYPLRIIQFLLAMTSYNTQWRHSICHLESLYWISPFI